MNRDSLVQLPVALREPGAGTGARFLLGVDGGATKTLAALLDLETRALHLAHGGPSNQDAVGPRAAVAALLQTADEAIERAGITHDAIAAAVLAIAGVDTAAVVRHVDAADRDAWIVVNDVVGAWATATGAGPGVAAISGTGSNVFGVGSDGRPWQVGGWGHLLGDGGSGYWLGIESIKAALRDRDGSGPQTALSDAALEFFGSPSVEALAAQVYSQPLTKSEIAMFATETCRHAEQGDPVAIDLYERAASELGGQITAVIRETGLAGDAQGTASFPVGLIGSGFKAGALFVEPLSRVIHESAPHALVSVVAMAPVGGCLLLAARTCGCGDAIGAEELSRLLDAAHVHGA
jgi:glucosamine kinase